MQREKVELQPAYVLHARSYRETSLLVELFTYSYGRVGLVARGARSHKSRRKAVLQPFALLNVSWVAGGDLATLTGAESGGKAHTIQGRDLACGFYLNELLMRLLIRHDPHPQLFRCYAEALQYIANPDNQLQALRIFEKRLLDELGYGLILDREVVGGSPIQPDLQYHYRLEEGPVAAESFGTSHEEFSGRTLIALREEQAMDSKQLKEARRLLNQALRRYLGDKPLKSRELVLGHSRMGGS